MEEYLHRGEASVNTITAQGLSSRLSEDRVETENSSLGETKWEAAEFEALFLEHYVRIVSVLVRVVGERTRAEELATETFLRLYRQPLLPHPEGNVGGWLYHTAVNLGIDSLRASARRKHYEQAAGQAMMEGSAADGPLDEVLRAERCRLVRQVLATLDPAQAHGLILRASGFSYKELAQCLGVALGSVGTMLARAEAKFHKRYVELHGDKEDL